MDFAELWRRITQGLSEPELFTVRGSDERFHAWHDPGGDGKPEAIWTKPLQGDKQVRLSQREANYRAVYDAWQNGGSDDAASYREVTLRGHYIFTVMHAYGLGTRSL